MYSDTTARRAAALPDLSGHLRRARVEALFSEAASHALVLVTAGAGWGKTQAAAAFLQFAAPSCLFVPLSRQDNLTARFRETFSRAAAVGEPALAAALAALPFPDTAALFHAFVTLLTETAERRGRLILLFDDVHTISEPAILRFFEQLLAARPASVGIVLMGRTLPPIDLSGLYAAGAVFRVTEEELQFTEQETRDFLRAQGLTLPPEVAAEVHRQTQGWIAAIYLIGLSLRHHAPEHSIAPAKRQIFELMEQELFAAYPPETRRGLIALAPLHQIPAELMPGHPALIHGNAAGNRFLHYDPASETYHVHALFLEFLLTKQSRLTEEERRETHLRLADWYRDHGATLDAMEQYRKCGRYDAVWALLLTYEIRVPVDVAEYFRKLLDEMPPALAESLSLLPVVRARLLLNNGQTAASEEALLQIIAQYDALPPTPEGDAVIGEACLFLAMISLLSFDERYVDYFKRAERCLPQGSRLIDRRLCFSEGNYMLLLRDAAPGSLARHVAGIAEAMPYAARAMNGAGYGVKYVTRAEAAYYTCDVKNAELYAYKAIYQAEQNGQYDTICAATFVLLRVHLYAGHAAKAEACLTELREKLELARDNAQARGVACTLDILTGWYYSRLHDLEKVPDWILTKEKRDKAMTPNSLARDPLIRAACLLVAEQDYQLAAYLDVLERYYDRLGLLPARIETQLYQSVAAHRLGKEDDAMRALKNAYALAEGNGLFMPFLELGKYMRAVLYTARQLDPPPLPSKRLEELYAKSATYEKRMRSARAQYSRHGGADSARALLTRRENEILQHLCQGLTSEEIAGNLYVSTSTVKKALINVYGKLGASNRADAVRIAMQNGMC